MANETISQGTLTGLLRQDHDRLKELFDRFESSEGKQRERAAKEALGLLLTHDAIEQTLLYPSVLNEKSIPRELVLRCEEAHHLVHLLMAELKVRPYNERYFAKFSKLVAGVREHIEEEENELFPAIESSNIDDEDLGRRMVELKEHKGALMLRSMKTGGGAFAGTALLAAVGWAIYKAFSAED